MKVARVRGDGTRIAETLRRARTGRLIAGGGRVEMRFALAEMTMW